MDHTAFGVDLLSEQEQVVGPVMQDKQAGVLDTFTCHGHIVDVVYSLVSGGVCVQILSEFHTYAFKPVDEILSGKISCAVEAHVLKEVSQTALIIIFKNRAYFLSNVEVSLTFRIVVVADVISKAIRELTYTHFFVNGQRRHLLGLGKRGEQQSKQHEH